PTLDPFTADFRVQGTSPAINAGTTSNLLPTITTDLLGNPRVVGATVDLGAYETPAVPLASATARARTPLQAFPNPAHTRVEVSLPGVLPGSRVQLFDALGRLCLNQPAAEKVVLSLTSLPPGIY
ncbi:T9SS type A sorting domain-containing protein, partial [Hymenobacter terrenus]|uniref:T9SS type A sorting domain-containing protein n=1 Tax=Hymenobacter terrenus TaxID=1629124 RepID=UPI0006199F06